MTSGLNRCISKESLLIRCTMKNPDGNKSRREIEILKLFFRVYCSNIHSDRKRDKVTGLGLLKGYDLSGIFLCAECKKEFIYSVTKLVLCPYDPKPSCKKCPLICYSDEHRIFMKKMMRFSGKHLIMHGRFDLLFRYFF